MSSQTKRVALIPAKRHAMVLDNLRKHGATSISELVQATRGSVSTIMRDLEQLEASGYLERTHGGARMSPPLVAVERERTLKAHFAEHGAGGQLAYRRTRREMGRHRGSGPRRSGL